MSQEDFPAQDPLEVAEALASDEYHRQKAEEAERKAQAERLSEWFDGSQSNAKAVKNYLESRPYEDEEGVHDPSTGEVVEAVDNGTAGKRMRGQWGNRYFEKRREERYEQSHENPADRPLDELFDDFGDAEAEGNKSFVNDYRESLSEKLKAEDVTARDLAELEAEVEFDGEINGSVLPEISSLVSEAIDNKVRAFHNRHLGKNKTDSYRARIERMKNERLEELRQENPDLVEDTPEPSEESRQTEPAETDSEAPNGEPHDDEPHADESEQGQYDSDLTGEIVEDEDDQPSEPIADDSNADEPPTDETDELPIEDAGNAADDNGEAGQDESPSGDEQQPDESRWARLKRGFWKHMYETPIDMSPMGPTIQPERPFEEWYADKQTQPGRISRAAEKTAEKFDMTRFVEYLGNAALKSAVRSKFENSKDVAHEKMRSARGKIGDLAVGAMVFAKDRIKQTSAKNLPARNIELSEASSYKELLDRVPNDVHQRDNLARTEFAMYDPSKVNLFKAYVEKDIQDWVNNAVGEDRYLETVGYVLGPGSTRYLQELILDKAGRLLDLDSLSRRSLSQVAEQYLDMDVTEIAPNYYERFEKVTAA